MSRLTTTSSAGPELNVEISITHTPYEALTEEHVAFIDRTTQAALTEIADFCGDAVQVHMHASVTRHRTTKTTEIL